MVAGMLVLPEGLVEGWVEVGAGHITRVEAGAPPADARQVAVVSPGFVDVHVHGGGGADLQAAAPESVARVVALHRRYGTTTLLASLVTGDLDALERSVSALAEQVGDGVFAGIHLEGPFLAGARCGAHDPSLVRPPATEDVVRLLRAGRGTVRIVTLAPELEGGLRAVRTLVDAGVVAAVGHTDATYALTRRAVDAGVRVATHLFNAMPPLHHRDPGPALALLEDERVTVEMIADGVHVHPALLAHVFAATAGPGGHRSRVALVTDAMAAAGVGDGRYRLGGADVDVHGGVARLRGSGVIAGSTLTMDAAVRSAVRAGVDRLAALRSATLRPARALGLDDRAGVLAVGRRADLVLLDDHLRVLDTWVAGRTVGP